MKKLHETLFWDDEDSDCPLHDDLFQIAHPKDLMIEPTSPNYAIAMANYLNYVVAFLTFKY